MREGDTLIRASAVGFTQRTSAAPSTFSLPSSFSLPAILSEECGNAALATDGGEEKEGKDKGERMESLGADRLALHADTFS